MHDWLRRFSPVLAILLPLLGLAGCGGGYPGLGLTGLAASASTIDAGQTVAITAVGAGDMAGLVWSVGGTGCAPGGCGSLSGSGGKEVYTAPVGISSPIQAVISSVMPGTGNTRSTTITVDPDPAISGALASGMVGISYSATLRGTGGTGALTLSIANGALPAGLTFNPASGVISGTPTAAGTASFTARVTDSAPTPFSATAPESITINAAGATLTLLGGNPPNGVVATAYATALTASGGTAPYTFSLAGGSLPGGLALGTGGAITGTPTAAGTFAFTAQVQDAASAKATAQFSITVVSPLSLTAGGLPNGTVGVLYSATIGVTGGTAPYACAITSGTLPAGLSLGGGCVVSGTPTAPGTANLTVKATDSSNPVQTTTGPVSLTISPAGLSLTTGMLPAGTVGTPYSSTIGVTGGSSPYSCTITSGALQTGLTLGLNCLVSGTPTASGTVNLQVQATDSSNPMLTATGPVSFTINAAPITLALGNPPMATVGTPYTGAVPVTGGTGPYTCAVAAGSALPAGLAFTTGCTIAGTPTTPGTTTVQVTANDSANPPHTKTGPVTVTVQGPAPLTFTGTLPNAILNQPYSQPLTAQGGVGPYTYAVTAGALPAGLSLNTSTGTISGTPTVPGASTFTLTATDSQTPAQTAPLPLTLLVVYAPTAQDGLLQGPYAFLFQGNDSVVAGTLAFRNATVGSFTANGQGVLTTGELDANHQGDNPTGAQVPHNALLGTYTIGTDDRGTLVISTLNADGTLLRSTTYAIALKAPVSPATTSPRGSMVLTNDTLLNSSDGSGGFLQQTASVFSTGLTGSYAFGLQGDTPCFPACTANLTAGPVATVGQMTIAGATITGETDTNLAQVNYPTAPLSGTSAAADSNGRVQLSLTNPNIPSAAYPSDFAVYILDTSRALVMSTDKHSAYILLAGNMSAQTTTTFSNASLSGQYVGYENSPSNPGLAGVALQSVANLSTATVFQGTANSTGTCTANYVEQGGTAQVINGVSGQGVGSAVLTYLLGAYAATGNSNCTVGTNGRAIINYPVPPAPSLALQLLGVTQTPPAPRVAYLTSTNTGYFLETGYAGLGNLEQQTGQPFSPGTLNGTYVFGTTPAVTAATLNASGEFTANGAGQASYMLDESVLAGNVNAVTLGVSGSGPYALTDAQNGRFTFNSDVIFAISPTRFVLVDKSATTTSPSVTLLQ